MIFAKAEKIAISEAYGGRFGFPFWSSFGNPLLPKPPFSRVCYRRVTCRYTYPMRQHEEKVMWGKVQCKIGKQRLAKIMQTRSAGSFRGPGADFWPHWIFKGVPKSTIFEKNEKNKMRKRRSKKRLKQKHDLLIDLSLNFGWMLVSFWSCFSYLYHSHMQPSKSSKPIVFPMNFNDFTLQRNMTFDDFPDLFRYQF